MPERNYSQKELTNVFRTAIENRSKLLLQKNS